MRGSHSIPSYISFFIRVLLRGQFYPAVSGLIGILLDILSMGSYIDGESDRSKV